MKQYFIVGLIFLSKLTFAQQTLKLDSNHKYTYYEVVSDSSSTKDSLMYRARLFLEQKTGDKLKVIALTDSSIAAKGVFVIDKTIMIASHPSGEVSYLFNFNTKKGKYRFWLTDFFYTPYHRDRYGNFVARTNFGKPLEVKVTPLKAEEWKAILSASATKAKEFADRFKKFTSEETNRKGMGKKVNSKEDW